MIFDEENVIPLLNRALGAVSRRGEATHYPSIHVLLALNSMMRQACIWRSIAPARWQGPYRAVGGLRRWRRMGCGQGREGEPRGRAYGPPCPVAHLHKGAVIKPWRMTAVSFAERIADRLIRHVGLNRLVDLFGAHVQLLSPFLEIGD
jgi:hypothetical protein